MIGEIKRGDEKTRKRPRHFSFLFSPAPPKRTSFLHDTCNSYFVLHAETYERNEMGA